MTEQEWFELQKNYNSQGINLLAELISEVNEKLPQGQKVGRKFTIEELENYLGMMDGDWVVNVEGQFDQNNSFMFYIDGNNENEYLHITVMMIIGKTHINSVLKASIITAAKQVHWDSGKYILEKNIYREL